MSYTINTKQFASSIRKHALQMVYKCNASHIGPCFSIADILSVLYGNILHVDPTNPRQPDRDRFILSKGHAAAILYATLAECGFFSVNELDTYSTDGSRLNGHISAEVPGIELSTGSLGHGLSVAAGIALALKHDNFTSRSYVLVGDGELNEGSCWESVMFAPMRKLDNLVMIVDRNNMQGLGRASDIIDMSPLDRKFLDFGWAVRVIDGHNHSQIFESFRDIPFEAEKPNVIIANTIKGKGVSFMENTLAWHYKSPNEEQVRLALTELLECQE
jgi:transketolase